MHTLSTRILSALAYDRGRGIRPGRSGLPGAASRRCRWSSTPRAVIGDDGPYERARQRRRERRELAAIPDWFSADDLIAAPWDTVDSRFV